MDEPERWKTVISALRSCSVTIDHLKKENTDLKLKVSSAMGRSLRLESELEKVNKKLTEMEWREMRQNLVFYNIEELPDENSIDLVTSLLQNSLSITTGSTSPLGNGSMHVEIDVAHRIGSKLTGKHRPMVVRFTTRKGKELVLTKARAKKMPHVKVSEQYPSEMKERRDAQLDALKTYKDIHKDSTTKVKLVKDKLLVGNQVVAPPFEINKLQPVPTDKVLPIKDITHTQIMNHNKSYFQGHAARVHSFKEAAAVKQALYQSPHIASSDHLIYAYAITDESGIRITGNSDDGEWSASRLLTDVISHNNESNIFIAVSRRHEGPNLGRKRFSIISKTAEDVLQLLNNV